MDDEGEGQKSAAELVEIHSKALAEFDKIQAALRDERKQCLQDRRFYSVAGAQWEGPLGLQYENKPKLEVNKIHLAVIRITNEYYNNRISVSFVPKDGTTGGDLTDVCKGLYRADEADGGEEAQDNAFVEALGGGFGAWRLRADYEDDQNDKEDEDKFQHICFEPIVDADTSVYFNLDAKRQDKADATKCFVLSSQSHDDFEEEYDENPSSWSKAVTERQFDWFTPDVVYKAEYYEVEEATEVQLTFTGLDKTIKKMSEEEYKEDADLRQELKSTGFKRTSKKTIKVRKIHKYLLCGNKVLKDYGYIAGKNIPIIPVYGKRWFIDNVERCMGHVRLAKDAQRLKNMQLSKLAEISALSTVEKPIFTPEQMAGHAVMWSEDNVVNNPYLLLNTTTDASGQPVQNGPIGYTKVPNISPAMAALLQITEQDIQDILGNQEAGEEVQSNLSGVAVELIQNKLDMQTFIYIANMAKAVKRCGEIWLSMAKEIYVEKGRKKKTINDAGEASSVTFMQPNVDGNGNPTIANDLTDASFDVTAIPGPTSASKRAATVRSLVSLLQVTQDPTTVQVLTSMIMLNMEGEGIQEIRDYFRKQLLQMGVAKPTPEEQQEMQAAAQNAAQQPPDANTQFLIASANQANADAMKSQADTVNVAAQAELNKAKAMQILASLKGQKIEQAFRAIEALQNQALNEAQIGTHTANANLANAQAQQTQNTPIPQPSAPQ